MVLGWKKFPKSHLESRLLVDKGAKIVIGGNVNIGYGARHRSVQVANLFYKGGTGTNISTTIICSEKIIIGRDVQIGRNVTIRDNNGGHYINRQGYKILALLLLAIKFGYVKDVLLCRESRSVMVLS